MLTDKQITDLVDPYMWVDGSVGARDHMVIARKIEYLVQQEKDAEIKSLCAKVDDLEDRLEKAQAGRVAYQVTGWGETEYPEVTFADTLEAAREAVVAMVFDDPIGGRAQAEEEGLLAGLDDAVELPWEVTFEIGGVEVRKVFIRSNALQSIPATKGGEQ